MKKAWQNLANDLWIVLLDILAVNAAYFLALMIRFYVNFEFRPSVGYYLTDWLRFTPFYTVICILVFFLFRLYGGMWRYAGISDMNRIIGANAVTVAVQVLGTMTMLGFARRMPLTYYVIGAVLQFLFVALIRFAYRMLLVEKKRISRRKTAAVSAAVVGSGETAKRAVRFLEENGDIRIRAILDPAGDGKSLDGVPVFADPEEALREVQVVYLADVAMSGERRREIRRLAEGKSLRVQDVTGYLANLGGRLSLTALLDLAEGPVVLCAQGKETRYENGRAALEAVTGRQAVLALRNLTVDLGTPEDAGVAGDESWAKQHQEETGEEISFF